MSLLFNSILHLFTVLHIEPFFIYPTTNVILIQLLLVLQT